MADFRRSFTHPISNTVVLNRLDIGKYLTDTMVGKFPVSQLPVVMHELTHHWCFSSPVGTALSILAMESRACIIAAGDGIEFDYTDICRSEVNYNFTMSMLQPLLEGIAEFAEFDLMVGSSRVVSMVMATVPGFFLQREQLGEKMLENFANGLMRYRTEALFLDRKKSLFANSFDCTKSGYLAGYLFVKGLLGITRVKYDLMDDTDFFLMYVRSFFFDDWEFVRLLLDRSASPLDSPGLIMDYFIKRVQLFFSMDHEATIGKFEERVLAHDGITYEVRFARSVGKLSSCPVTDFVHRQDIQLLLNDHVSTMEAATYDSPAQIALIDSLLNFRDAISIGHAVMKARVSTGGMLMIFNSEDIVLLSFAAPENFKTPGDYELDVDTLLVRDPSGLFVIFSRNGAIVHHMALNQMQLTPGQTERFIGRNRIIGALSIWNKAADVLQEGPVYMEYHENALAYLELNLNTIYQMSAQIYTPDHLLEQAAAALSENGVYDVMGSDELLEKCVAASMLYNNRIDPRSPKAQDFLKDADIHHLVNELNAPIVQKLGFKNFAYLEELRSLYSTLL